MSWETYADVQQIGTSWASGICTLRPAAYRSRCSPIAYSSSCTPRANVKIILLIINIARIHLLHAGQTWMCIARYTCTRVIINTYANRISSAYRNADTQKPKRFRCKQFHAFLFRSGCVVWQSVWFVIAWTTLPSIHSRYKLFIQAIHITLDWYSRDRTLEITATRMTTAATRTSVRQRLVTIVTVDGTNRPQSARENPLHLCVVHTTQMPSPLMAIIESLCTFEISHMAYCVVFVACVFVHISINVEYPCGILCNTRNIRYTTLYVFFVLSTRI